MGTFHLPHCTDVDWLTVGPIAPHAGAIKQHFADGRCALSSSLKEVADVLRHRALSTTQVYAKLDSRNLVEVALPWPGSAS